MKKHFLVLLFLNVCLPTSLFSYPSWFIKAEHPMTKQTIRLVGDIHVSEEAVTSNMRALVRSVKIRDAFSRDRLTVIMEENKENFNEEFTKLAHFLSFMPVVTTVLSSLKFPGRTVVKCADLRTCAYNAFDHYLRLKSLEQASEEQKKIFCRREALYNEFFGSKDCNSMTLKEFKEYIEQLRKKCEIVSDATKNNIIQKKLSYCLEAFEEMNSGFSGEEQFSKNLTLRDFTQEYIDKALVHVSDIDTQEDSCIGSEDERCINEKIEEGKQDSCDCYVCNPDSDSSSSDTEDTESSDTESSSGTDSDSSSDTDSSNSDLTETEVADKLMKALDRIGHHLADVGFLYEIFSTTDDCLVITGAAHTKVIFEVLKTLGFKIIQNIGTAWLVGKEECARLDEIEAQGIHIDWHDSASVRNIYKNHLMPEIDEAVLKNMFQ